MKRSLLAAASAVAIAVSSGAAQATPFDWSGIYFGVHGGLGSGDATGSAELSGLFTGCFFGCGKASPFSFDAEDTYRVQGAFGGGQIGADFANSSFLVGIVGDFSWSGMSGNGTLATITFDLPVIGDVEVFSADVGTNVNWTGTVRGRAGVIGNQNTLAYITGGLAVANVDSMLGYTILPDLNGGFGESLTHNTTRYGFTIGAGLEHPLNDNVTIGFEYLYTDLGSWNIFETSGTVGEIECGTFGCFGAEADYDISAENSLRYHAIKIILNVKFGGGRGAPPPS